MRDEEPGLHPDRSEQALPTTVRAKWERPTLLRLMANEAFGGTADTGDDDTFESADTS
jgi:hypothetical protein